MKRLTGTIVAAGLLSAPAFAAKPQIQWDQEFDFSQVRTFTWQPSAGESLANTEPFLHEHIINIIEYQLTNTGLTEVDADADLIVTYYGSTETNYTLNSNSYGYGFGGYGMGGWGRYGYGGMGSVSTSTSVNEYQTGTLVVDIVSAESEQLVWRGVVSDISVTDDMEKLMKRIDKGIEKMVKQSQKLRETD